MRPFSVALVPFSGAAVERRHDVDGERAAVGHVAAGVGHAHEQLALAAADRARRDRLAAQVRAGVREPVGAAGAGVGQLAVVVLGGHDLRRRARDVEQLDAVDARVVAGGQPDRLGAAARPAGQQAERLDGHRRRGLVVERDVAAVEEVVDRARRRCASTECRARSSPISRVSDVDRAVVAGQRAEAAQRVRGLDRGDRRRPAAQRREPVHAWPPGSRPSRRTACRRARRARRAGACRRRRRWRSAACAPSGSRRSSCRPAP